MRIWALIAILMSISFIVGPGPFALASDAGAKVEASGDRTTIYIGDRIKYSITVTAPPEVEIEFPKIQGTLGPFVVKEGPLERSVGHERSELYTITIYTTGRQSIPELEVKCRPRGGEWTSLKTNAIPVEVKSLLAESPKENDIRDIKGILAFPRNLLIPFLFWPAACALAVGGLFLLVRKALMRKREAPPKPAHVIAYEELERIKMSGLLAEGKAREYYFRLSNCIRHYLENRFSLKAPEMTTEEFLLAVRDSGTLEEDYKKLLKDFLSSADMVKFAKYGPSPQEAESSFEFAKRFVDETREDDGR
jgi:hypothetical protein